MTPEVKEALASKLLAMADDELILGHRNSQWTGHAPILEEDIAFTNIALDEIGHAILWYSLLSELMGKDRERYPDTLAFFRDAQEFRSAHLVELPKGDWAFSMVRQYLFDVAEMVNLAELIYSRYRPMADAAAKVQKEERYHLRHTGAWVRRLGLGTEESHSRTQKALETLWPYTLQLFEPLPLEDKLVEAEIVVSPQKIRLAWENTVFPLLREAGLSAFPDATPVCAGREEHSEHLAPLLAEMQEVARLCPGAKW